MTINLFSDTQTRPTAAMRPAMAEAEVGDEQRNDDPTVNAPSTVNPVRVLSTRKPRHSHLEPDAFETVPDLPALPGYDIEKLLGYRGRELRVGVRGHQHDRRWRRDCRRCSCRPN